MANMRKDQIAEEILDLRAEAASARELAASFDDPASVADLLNYAVALEAQAAELESMWRQIPVRPLSCAPRFEFPAHPVVARPSIRAKVR